MVEEILDLLHIEQCSIMAHSAGAPYALSFANKLPSRIRGDVCLLAPWVGGSESSKFLTPYYLSLPMVDLYCRRLQVAQIRTQQHFEDRPSCRVEDSGVDDR